MPGKCRLKVGDAVTVSFPKNVTTDYLWDESLRKWAGKSAKITGECFGIVTGKIFYLNRSELWFRLKWLKKVATDARN